MENVEFSEIQTEVAPGAPDKGAQEVVQEVKRQFQEAFDFKQPYAKDWGKWYLLYAGRHWDGRQPEWMSTPVVNLTFSVIQTILPILTDSRPQISIIPRRPEMEHTSSILRQIVEWLWERNDLDVLLPKVMLNTLIFGNGFLKVIWDPAKAEGQGDVKVVPIDPSHIFVSPFARSLEEADYIIHAENLPVSLVKRMFPGTTVKAVGAEEPRLTLNRTVTSQGPSRSGINDTVRSTDGSAVYGYGSGGSEHSTGDSDTKIVTVYERWERRDGKIWQTVVANDKILLDAPSPFSSDSFPFVHFVDHPCTWTFWAMGEVQQVERLQIEINRRRGHILDILRYTASPIMVVDPASGLDYASLRARPGLVIPAEGGLQSVGWLQPPVIPQALFEINEVDKRDFDVVLGNVDVLQGRRPAGVEAGVAIEMLQEAANVRMRLKVRNMENSLRKLGELMVKMVQQFYDTQRVFMIAGNETLMAEKPLNEDMWLTINQMTQASPEGQPMGMENQIPPPGDAQFDVRIGPGSTLPVSRSHEFQKALTLYSMQILDDEGVMKRSGFPRWDEELARSRNFWGMKMMQAQQAEAPAAGAEEPVPEEASQDEINQSRAEVGDTNEEETF